MKLTTWLRDNWHYFIVAPWAVASAFDPACPRWELVMVWAALAFMVGTDGGIWIERRNQRRTPK